MAYYSGTASTAADLLTALKNACTDMGWTVSGNIISKGTSFFEVTSQTNGLEVLGGTGIASGALTGFPALTSSVNEYRKLKASLVGVQSPIVWPVTYSIHIFNNPQEVFLFAKYSIDKYVYVSFGQFLSPIAGTGNWYAGTGGTIYSVGYVIGAMDSSGGSSGGNSIPSSAVAPFYITTTSGTIGNTPNGINSFVHHGLDGNTWSKSGINQSGSDAFDVSLIASSSTANASRQQLQQIQRSPNAWNSEEILIPIQPSIARDSSKVSILGEINNARYMRIANVEPDQIITRGSDRWKVYPFHRKNISVPNGLYGSNHTGTLGWAIRYDGP